MPGHCSRSERLNVQEVANSQIIHTSINGDNGRAYINQVLQAVTAKEGINSMTFRLYHRVSFVNITTYNFVTSYHFVTKKSNYDL